MKSLTLSGSTIACITLLQPLMWPWINPVKAQTTQSLNYSFYGQSVSLEPQTDTVGVQFQDTATTARGIGGNAPFLQLQKDLEKGGARGISGGINVNPLGSQFAIVSSSNPQTASLTERIEQQSYVADTVPVLKMNGSDETILLPNEIILNVDSTLNDKQFTTLLKRENLELIRPLRFTENRYLVRSKTPQGLGLLNLSQRLGGLPGVQSASPNFVQTTALTIDPFDGQSNDPEATSVLQTWLSDTAPAASDSPFASRLMPLLWHLNDRITSSSQKRRDIKAMEAWQNSNAGQGVTVAVIDSLIQWDHPDLINNLATPPEGVELLRGEKHGWDFAENDPDTRLSAEEVKGMLPTFQSMFRDSDAQILAAYPKVVKVLKNLRPDFTPAQTAQYIRNYVVNEIASEFHGTWSAGVISAQPSQPEGVIGVAPRAKFLPIRVFGLNESIKNSAVVEALYYAEARKVDVINLSLGSLLPGAEVEAVFEILDRNPNLVIVAAAGNENLDGVGFPAGIPGVVSVGATNSAGKRSPYSNYGGRLDVVAPGGDTSLSKRGGIFTTGGTFLDAFWAGLEEPKKLWGPAIDPRGKYVSVQGTSYSAPAVSGVLALMKGEDPERNLNREQLLEILKQTANYQGLTVSKNDRIHYRLQSEVGFGLVRGSQLSRPTGIFRLPEPIPARNYYFGAGIVDAAAAVEAVKQAR